MRVSTKCHLQATVELVEIISIAGVVAMLADIIWLGLDSYACGFDRPELLIIFVMLGGSFVVATIGVWKYHVRQMRQIRKEALATKLQIQRCKRRNQRKGEAK